MINKSILLKTKRHRVKAVNPPKHPPPSPANAYWQPIAAKGEGVKAFFRFVFGRSKEHLPSTTFLIALHCPHIEEQGKNQQRAQLHQQIGKATTFEIDHAHHLHEVL